MVALTTPEFCVRMKWLRETHLIPWLGRQFGESSVRALARRMGLKHASYQVWERRSVPHLWKLQGALRKLGIARAEAWAAWLLTGHDQPPAWVESDLATPEGDPTDAPANGLTILRKVRTGEVDPEEAWTTLKTMWKAGIAAFLGVFLVTSPGTASASTASDARRSHIFGRGKRGKNVA